MPGGTHHGRNKQIRFNSSIVEAIIDKGLSNGSYESENSLLASIPFLRNGIIQSRQEAGGFEGITVARTGWVTDIRYYDCPMGKTTTFPLQMTLNKKGHGEPRPQG